MIAYRTYTILTRTLSHILPPPNVVTAADIQAVEQACERVYRREGHTENRYAKNDLRHVVWQNHAEHIRQRVKAAYLGEAA